MREAAVHGSLPHLQGELGLPLPLRGPDPPVLQAVLAPGPERMPRRVAELGNGARRAQVELDAGLDCQPALICAVHAVLCATFSWSRITTALPSRKSGLTKHSRNCDCLFLLTSHLPCAMRSFLSVAWNVRHQKEGCNVSYARMSVTYSRMSADNGFTSSCLERIAGSALPKGEPKGTGESLHLHFTKQQALTIADDHHRVPGVRPHSTTLPII